MIMFSVYTRHLRVIMGKTMEYMGMSNTTITLNAVTHNGMILLHFITMIWMKPYVIIS